MTPAITLLKRKNIAHQVLKFEHDPSCRNFGLEAAAALKVDADSVFKTLLFSLNGQPKQLAVAIIPVSASLNLKAAAKAASAKKAEMADPAIAQAVTGYLVGGISPVAQKKRLPTFIDRSALDHQAILVSAGRRGLEVSLSAESLADVTGASFVGLADSAV